MHPCQQLVDCLHSPIQFPKTGLLLLISCYPSSTPAYPGPRSVRGLKPLLAAYFSLNSLVMVLVWQVLSLFLQQLSCHLGPEVSSSVLSCPLCFSSLSPLHSACFGNQLSLCSTLTQYHLSCKHWEAVKMLLGIDLKSDMQNPKLRLHADKLPSHRNILLIQT